jgi:hypothetical protein
MKRLRLLVHVEGQTELNFVNRLLGEHLAVGYSCVRARLAGNPRMQRGGIRSWQGVKRDILKHLKQDREMIVTTMVDYYALPQNWPGRAKSPSMNSASEKAKHVEAALLADIGKEMGPRFNPTRFVPLIVMHEFEALLFSDPDQFAQRIGRGDLASELHNIRQAFPNPEEINDSPENAPSKRIERLFPGYNKVRSGVNAANDIGLTKIRQQCPHFNDWLNRLESLPKLLSAQA